MNRHGGLACLTEQCVFSIRSESMTGVVCLEILPVCLASASRRLILPSANWKTTGLYFWNQRAAERKKSALRKKESGR